MTNQTSTCIYCDQSDQTTPLLLFQYQGKQYSICPQHLPILIHKPIQMADKLLGLELLSPFEGHS